MSGADKEPVAQPRLVRVAEFRQEIRALERQVNVHYHACVGVGEVQRWMAVTALRASELKSLRCVRAAPEDRASQVRAIEQAQAQLLAATLRVSELQSRRPVSEPVQVATRVEGSGVIHLLPSFVRGRNGE